MILQAHLSNPIVGVYFKTYAELGTDFFSWIFVNFEEKLLNIWKENEFHVGSLKKNLTKSESFS